MRVLVVTNISPGADVPGRGNFVRDQVAAMRDEGADVDLFSFPTGKRALARSVGQVRRRLRRGSFDLVHAHYGLAGWSAVLAGASPLVVTFHGTDVRHRVVGALSRRLLARVDLVAGASPAVFSEEGGRRGLPVGAPGTTAVLPAGADLERFTPGPREEARRRLGLDPEGRYLLFPAADSRRVKRHDLAAQVARLAGADLVVLGHADPERMPDWVNASSAVLVTSDNEGFGLAAVEALACDVPVLSTPVGIAPMLLSGVDGCLVEPFHAGRWTALAKKHLESMDARVRGRRRAAWFSSGLMAQRVLAAYRDVLAEGSGEPSSDLS